jgi:cellulose synthase/poly-beta-1,6-N-acetylglucosamine synthase-like glycosyltransferase
MSPLTLTLAGMAVYAVLNARAWRNLRELPNNPGTQQPLNPANVNLPNVNLPKVNLPKVSLLVPARNEASNLEHLLPSLIAQDYANLEIIVLDDHSDDGTLGVIRKYAALDSRLLPLEGADLPRGWLGKPHACQQLSRAASGELLIFTDADTLWSPDGVSLIVHAFAVTNADALCAWPEQECSDPLSSLLQPLQQWSLMAFLPLALVPARRFPMAVAANGQCLAFGREIYNRIGGHTGVSSSVIEDMALARNVKNARGRFQLFNAAGVIRTCMYAGVGEAFEGYTKNVFPAFGASRLALFVAPWIWLITQPGLEPAFAVLLSLLPRTISDRASHYPNGLSLLHPLAILVWAVVGLESWHRYKRGTVSWKGRSYDLRESRTPSHSGKARDA